MLNIEWVPVTKTEEIPPMGDKLKEHLAHLKGSAKHASCSAWNLLYNTLLSNGLSIGDVAFTPIGKPYFPESDVYFSISHSRGVCAVAVSDHIVGVDVEIIKATYPPHLIEQSLSEREIFDGDFTRIWCRKEAVAKMTGAGISGYPWNIETTEYEFAEQQIEYGGQKYWVTSTIEANKTRCIFQLSTDSE